MDYKGKRDRSLGKADSLGRFRPSLLWLFNHTRRDDRENLTKEDLRKLLGASVDDVQLDAAFQHLDVDNDGEISKDEFLGGFSTFLKEAPNTPSYEKPQPFDPPFGRLPMEEHYETSSLREKCSLNGREREDFQRSLTQLSSHNRCSIELLWKSLSETNPELLGDFEDFVAQIATEVEGAQRALNKQRMATKQEAIQLDEEIESRLNDAKTTLQIQTAYVREQARIRTEERLVEKEMELFTVRQKLQELETDVVHGQQVHTALEQQYFELHKEKEELEERLEVSEKKLQLRHLEVGTQETEPTTSECKLRSGEILAGGSEVLPGGSEVLTGGSEVLPGGSEVLTGGSEVLTGGSESDLWEENESSLLRNGHGLSESDLLGSESDLLGSESDLLGSESDLLGSESDLLGSDLQRNDHESDLQRNDLQRNDHESDLQRNDHESDLQRNDHESDLQRNDLQRNDLQRSDLQRNDLQRSDLQRNDLQRNDHESDLQRNDLQRNDHESDLQRLKKEYEQEIAELREKLKCLQPDVSSDTEDSEVERVARERPGLLTNTSWRRGSRSSLMDEIVMQEGAGTPVLRGEPLFGGSVLHNRTLSLPDLYQRTRPRSGKALPLTIYVPVYIKPAEPPLPPILSPVLAITPPTSPEPGDQAVITLPKAHMTTAVQTQTSLEPEEMPSVEDPLSDPYYGRWEVIGKDEAEEGSPLVRVKEKKRTDSVESRQSTSSVGSRSGGRRSLHRDRLTGEALRGEKTPSLLGYEAKYPPLEFIENLATPPDYVFKILLVGNSYVGKSSFLMRLCTNAFSTRYSSTIGVDFYSKALKVEDKVISLQLWDTAGQERFQSVTKAYYRGAHGVILMYDITQEESFIAVKSWINSIQENMDDEMPPGMLLVGNKHDLDEQNEREVSLETGKTFARIYGADFMEASAKTGYNVGNALMLLIKVIKSHYEQDSGDGREHGIQVTKQQTGSKCCGR